MTVNTIARAVVEPGNGKKITSSDIDSACVSFANKWVGFICRCIETRHMDYFDVDEKRYLPQSLIYSYGEYDPILTGFRQIDLEHFGSDLTMKLRAWVYDVVKLIIDRYWCEDEEYTSFSFDIKLKVNDDCTWSILIKDQEVDDEEGPKAWHGLTIVSEEDLLGDDEAVANIKKYS